MNIKERDERLFRVCEDIENGEIKLQPDFQRGEVWNSSKKKLLIDTILRKWHIPPVHVVLMEDGTYEVLDGQQRLTAIRDFLRNDFKIDGNIQPTDDYIFKLNGKKYSNLTDEIKRDFDRYTLKINEIKDYNVGEPSELFHRLNQTVKLTSSEARNAIYGDVRNSISTLVESMRTKNVNKDILGFSNSRMAYNDLLSRIIIYLESDSLRAVINEAVLNQRYRKKETMKLHLIEAIEYSIDAMEFFNNERLIFEYEVSLTKASSLNWIYILCAIFLVNGRCDFSVISKAFFALEISKAAVKQNLDVPTWILEYFGFTASTLRELMLIYIERSSSRVMSLGSILIRDLIQVISLSKINIKSPISPNDTELLDNIISSLNYESEPKSVIEDKIEHWRMASI